MTAEKQQEFSAKIVAANKSQLVVIIYDLFLEYLNEAREHFNSNKRKDFSKCVKNMRDCLSELISSIQCNNELAPNYAALYLFCNEQLDSSEIKYDIKYLEDVIPIITNLREGFLEAANTDTSKAVMENAQSIYSGLTYGRDVNPVEIMNDPSKNRGFLV